MSRKPDPGLPLDEKVLLHYMQMMCVHIFVCGGKKSQLIDKTTPKKQVQPVQDYI